MSNLHVPRSLTADFVLEAGVFFVVFVPAFFAEALALVGDFFVTVFAALLLAGVAFAFAAGFAFVFAAYIPPLSPNSQ